MDLEHSDAPQFPVDKPLPNNILIMAVPGKDHHVPGGHNATGSTAWAYHEWLSFGAMSDTPYSEAVWFAYCEHMAQQGYFVLDQYTEVSPGGAGEFTGDFSAGYGVEIDIHKDYE